MHKFHLGIYIIIHRFFWPASSLWPFDNSLFYPLNLLHLRPNCSFLFSSITLTISMVNEPSRSAGFEPDDVLCIQLPVRVQRVGWVQCVLSASTLDVVHPTVSKLITVIRLKRGELGSAWPAACFLWTSPVRRRTSHTGSGWATGTRPCRRLLLMIGSRCFCLYETHTGVFNCTHAVIMTSL